jgi:hypothetical protein
MSKNQCVSVLAQTTIRDRYTRYWSLITLIDVESNGAGSIVLENIDAESNDAESTVLENKILGNIDVENKTVAENKTDAESNQRGSIDEDLLTPLTLLTILQFQDFPICHVALYSFLLIKLPAKSSGIT